MTTSLPASPSIEYLKKEAKHLLHAHKNGDPSCCAVLRNLRQCKDNSDGDILKLKLSLADVQYALAMEYGFKSWKELKRKVEEPGSASEQPACQPEKIVAEIIGKAVKDRASDMHLEPMTNEVKVRYRVDGVLQELPSLSRETGMAVVEHIMQMGGLDLGRRNVPQDGRIVVSVEGRTIDIRVNVSPVIHGSVVALRLLDRSAIQLALDRLGMEPDQLDLYRKQILKSNGLILAAGPTGCGKTTTLYATLMELNSLRRKIMTVEDPVEFVLEGVDQMPIRPDLGFGFEQALRSILRQGANVILAGEIRNIEIAQLCVQAVLTGHMVFSTLHTNDCPGTLMRLLNMGVEPWLVTDAVSCVVAQRLVRLICENCKTEFRPDPAQFASLQLKDDDRVRPMYRGTGCEKCNRTGYKGREAIYSILQMTPAVVRQVLNKDVDAIQSAARESGWTTLREAGIRKVFRGETTAEEILLFT